MERDFLGLNQKKEYYYDCSKMAEDDDHKSKESCKTSVGEMQWPFSSKVFLPPQYNMNMKAKENEQRNFIINSGFDHSTTKPPPFTKMIQAPTTEWSFLPTNGFHETTLISNLSSDRNNEKSAQLPTPFTIFYSGSVHVYNGVSPEMAETIFSIAGKGSLPLNSKTKQTVKPAAASDDIQPPTTSTIAYPQEMASAKFIAGALTMARKATLARFLQKRKYRLTSGKPYNLNSEKKLQLCTPQDTNRTLSFLSMPLQEEDTGSSNIYS